MDRAELLTDFTSKVDEFERYQTFINKAKSQSSKFAAAVVEKVIKDNTEKSQKVVEEIIPLVGDIEDVIGTLTGDKQKILDGRQTSQFALEELELRMAIGEMDDKQFEEESGSLKAAIGSIDARVGVVEGELSHFRDVMSRWSTLGTSSGFLSPEPAAPKKEEKKADKKGKGAQEAAPAPSAPPRRPEPMEEIEVEAEADVAVAEEELDVSGFEEERPEARIEKTSIAEDLSDILGEAEQVGQARQEEIDILGDEEEVEVEAGAADEVSATEESRRAVLLYQEATPEEQIYPFNGDELTLGRGRDNDIQVKNDSKVSRYHCKLYRRGPNFYIEDNKSANGTLVNGELITERRLFGGEEVIIGETFFRFRIMD